MRDILTQPMVFSSHESIPGAINAALVRCAERIPLEPLVRLLYSAPRSKQPARLVFTGYSVGGAIAELVALRLLYSIKASPPTTEPDTWRSLCARVHLQSFGAPLVGDRVFAQGVQQLLDETRATFSFVAVSDDVIPTVMYVLGDVATVVFEARKQETATKQQLKALLQKLSELSKLAIEVMTAATFPDHDVPRPRAGGGNRSKGNKEKTDGLIATMAKLLHDPVVTAGEHSSIGAYGMWLRYCQNGESISMVHHSEAVKAIVTALKDPTSTSTTLRSDQHTIRLHSFDRFNAHFSMLGRPSAEDLCHPSRFPAPVDDTWLDTALQWGNLSVSPTVTTAHVIKRELQSSMGQRLTVYLQGQNLSFITDCKLGLSTEARSRVTEHLCTVLPGSRDSELQVSAEIITQLHEAIDGTEVTLHTKSHFDPSIWQSHNLILPEPLQVHQQIPRREARVSNLTLGELLNEAVICCSIDASDVQLREMLDSLEVDVATHAYRWTSAAADHYKSFVDKVTDADGCLRPEHEAQLTFLDVAQVRVAMDSKSPLLSPSETELLEFGEDANQWQPRLGAVSLESRAAAAKLTLSAIDDLSFRTALERHDIPPSSATIDDAGAWSLGEVASWSMFSVSSGLAADKTPCLPAPAGLLSDEDCVTLERASASRTPHFQWEDPLAMPFGRAFLPGKRMRADFIQVRDDSHPATYVVPLRRASTSTLPN